eukprot:TRINITY_DN5444_c0_g1_i3.p1 TRINITY_DN5444_c0_g1~~TRINITY_DN5444_c0_g1_i3.p1  ORF type:complete len:175 (-),score=47.58 TRINITY_DN5444_c0_g1_i3:78-602(-)
MFLIVDSNNSGELKENLAAEKTRGGAFVSLFSPEQYDVGSILDDGSIFSLFLQSPLLGLCSLCCLSETSERVLKSSLELVEEQLGEFEAQMQMRTGKLFGLLPQEFQAFVKDGYVRKLIVRFIFCQTVMTMHKESEVCTSIPALPQEILEWEGIRDLIGELGKQLGVLKELGLR